MPKVMLESPAAMTREQASNGLGQRRPRFWIARRIKGRFGYRLSGFITIGFHPAYLPLKTIVNLQPGNYLLGAGNGLIALRKYFNVNEKGDLQWT